LSLASARRIVTAIHRLPGRWRIATGDRAINIVLKLMTVRQIAPQFLVEDLDVAVAFYVDALGFTQAIDWGDFYASVERDGQSIHLKCAPKTVADRAHRRTNEHLDAFIEVTNAESLSREFQTRNVTISKPLTDRPWGARDFYVEDPDGYILCFSQTL
jgi:catechol 2,3-dioxygenase-like lactoylglutathione lyase family enzyme